MDELWGLYNSLTDEQKELVDPNTKALLDQMEKDYRNKLAYEAKLKEEREKQEAELEALYKARDDNNGLFHPKKEAEIESQILALEKKLRVAHKPDGWESFCDTVESAGAHAVTFVASAVEGFVDLGEGVIDGTIYGASKALQLFGVDDKWAENIIAYDVSGKMYDGFVDLTGIDKDIAYGPAHTYGNFAGEMGGYYALSAVPYVGTALCCVAGAGSKAEDSINRQLEENGEVNDWIVFGESGLGALEGFGFGKAAQGAKAGFKAIKEVGLKNTLKQTIGSISGETLKETAKNGGKIALKTAGQTLTDADLYVETASVLGDDVIHGLETGEWDYGRMALETVTVLGENYAGNLFGNVAQDLTSKNKFNTEMDAKTPEQRSQSWEDYYKEAYGADAVEHTSGPVGALLKSDYNPGRRLSGDQIGEYKQKYINMYSEKGYSKVELDEVRSNFNDISGQAQRLGQQYPDFDEKTFYEIVCMDPKTRPDPTTYLPKSIISDWETDFSSGKAYCVMATGTPNSAFDNFVESKGCLGPPGESQYVIGESTKLKLDKIINGPGNLDFKQKEIAKILGVPSDQFSDGFVVIERTIDDANPIKMSTGSESTANKWYTPYGQTTAGVKEGVLPSVSGVKVGYDVNGKRVIENDGIKIIYDTEG